MKLPKIRPMLSSLPITVLLILGAALRLRQYLTGRSLWLDEAMLALNIVNRDLAGMFQPLDMNQGAPVGYLLVVKLFNILLGRNELVLRLFPFLAGLASLWLFALLLKGTTRNQAGLLITLAAFAVNPQLVYYASESKQYMVDVAVALASLLLALPVFRPRPNNRDFVVLGAAGILGMWFSHPALFVLAGIGLTLFIQALGRRDFKSLRPIILTGSAWAVNFAALYLINLRQLQGNSFFKEYWAGAFPPSPPWSDLGWYVDFLRESVHQQFDIPYAFPVVCLCLVAGWYALWRERHPLALTIGLTSLFTFLAAVFKLYPVQGRLALFLLPLGILLLGKAVDLVHTAFSGNRIAGNFVTIALGLLILAQPFITSAQYFITPKYYEHIRPYMDYLSAMRKADDAFFVTYWAEPAFRFYAPFYKLKDVQYATSQREDYSKPEQLAARIDPLIGKKRVWVLFSHVYEQDGFNEMDFMLAHLDEVGKQVRQLRIPDTSVFLYLYDLSEN